MTIYTMIYMSGRSTRALDDFIALLRLLGGFRPADVRTIP
jgi:hypothetical protein